MALLGDAGAPFRVIRSCGLRRGRASRSTSPGPPSSIVSCFRGPLTVAEQEQCLDELRGAAASAACGG